MMTTPKLDSKGIHVWHANLNLSKEKVEGLSNYLSSDEVSRANKFRFIEHKRRFIVARGILRELLGTYLDIPPDQIEFEYSSYGKPQLAKSMGNSSLQFNISHSLEYAIYGFSNDHLIGVDLEYLRQTIDTAELAERFFTYEEFQFVANLSDKEKPKAFFQLWTAKEAYLKAIGTGLSNSLTDLELTFDRAKKPKLLAIKENTCNTNNWSMYHFTPTVNYIAAIIINTRIPKQRINIWNW